MIFYSDLYIKVCIGIYLKKKKILIQNNICVFDKSNGLFLIFGQS